ncbi:uncharacterized protein UV8b_05293 [Ustilaginoidea virens]|uniref:Uncharacterized protein n=1 Tax=Ustilaginoidea virens TaxID=1159556 RepID=A0A8E5MIY1_USTVR|nr:uncharacterized protein UV8b_05293 [Ustilaginoidea virens]QUC21052.1 hypothetical protein UV8b_05293 [Ustilaginoidea virens]
MFAQPYHAYSSHLRLFPSQPSQALIALQLPTEARCSSTGGGLECQTVTSCPSSAPFHENRTLSFHKDRLRKTDI